MLELTPAPTTLPPDRHPPFGRYQGYIENTQVAGWDATDPWLRRWKRKSWFFAGVFSEDWILGCAIADAGYLGLAFTYYYHRPSGTYFEEKAMQPFAFRRGFLPELWSPWGFRSRSRTWDVEPLAGAGGWHVKVAGKRIRFDLQLRHAFPGLTAIAPAQDRPFNSTFKIAAIPLSGSLAVDGKDVALGSPLGVVDFTWGYPARRVIWNWACLAGRTEEGRTIGVNAVAHFNDGLENAIWLDGDLLPMSQVQFQPGKNRARDTWRIDSADEMIEIAFEPEGARAENLHLGLVTSHFVQPFGRFTGTLRRNGRASAIRGFGIVEDHRAVW
jgi:hypothetical protein